MAGFWMLHGAIGADIIDFDELGTGERREGAFSVCGSFFMEIGLAVAIGAYGFSLNFIGFDESLDANQPEGTLTHMCLFLAEIPIALYFIVTFDLTKKRAGEVRAELEKRRRAV